MEQTSQMELVLSGKRFIIHKFSPIAGRRIVASYPLTAVPKLAEYEKNEEAMLTLMKFVDVIIDGQPLRLTTAALVDNHVPSWDDLVRLEFETLKFNIPFLTESNVRSFGELIMSYAVNYLSKAMDESLRRIIGDQEAASPQEEV